MEIKHILLEEIKAYDKNPLNHPQEQINKLAKIIQEYGFKVPILLDSELTIIAGHGRALAAQSLGLEEVPCIIADDLTEDQIKAFRIADNKSREGSIWDNDILKAELRELVAAGQNVELLGVDFEEMEKLFPEEDFFPGDVREVEEPPIEEEEEPFTKQGDLWLLGRHKLLCGDSTKEEDVNRLMGDEKADLKVTDPPYNINYEGTEGKKIINDNMGTEEFYNFLLAYYKNSFNVMREGAAYYIFHADLETKAFRGALEEAGFKISQCLIWVKNGFNLSRQDYNWRHEPCLYGWKEGKGHYFVEDYSQDTVLETDIDFKGMGKKDLVSYIKTLHKQLEEHSTIIRENKPLRNDVHPTMKPLKLLARLILNSSKKGDIVIDPFGGSGSTLMTCEQIDRIARTIEFDPKYADVIVKRYHSMEAGEIKLIRDGKEYSWEEVREDL